MVRLRQPSIEESWCETQMKKAQSEEERSKSGGTPAVSVDALMSIAHPLGEKSSVGGVLVHMPHVRTPTPTHLLLTLPLPLSAPPHSPTPTIPADARLISRGLDTTVRRAKVECASKIRLKLCLRNCTS